MVSTVEHGDDVLRAEVGDADFVRVVVPVVRQGVLDWLANDEAAISRAEEVAERTAEQLPGETAEAGAGEPNVELAIRDALDRWEPRVFVETVEFNLDYVGEGRLIIDIGYRVRATNTMRNLVYPFYVIPAEELE